MRERWPALMVVILIVLLLSALMLISGCGTPPRGVYKYEATYWYEINGKRYEVDAWGYAEYP